MNAIVLGNGKSGQAAEALLKDEGATVRVLEGEAPWPSGTWELCVASPGIPLDHPWQIAARAAGVPVVSELQLGVERFRAHGGRLLAVTGSKGKSSVVKLVADAVGGVPCGNYGTPVCEVALSQNASWAVVEVSSFQMETTSLPPETFEAAAVLNLQEDHLDRHGGVEAYHALKMRLLDFAKVRISPVHEGDTPGDEALLAGSYFDNPVLRENGLCAIRLMRVAGLSNDAIHAAFMRFEPLPHRMQTVGAFDGVTWIDDSKATSLAALAAGVTMAASRFPGTAANIHLIAGGLPKGDAPETVLDSLAERVKKAYLVGTCAEALARAWSRMIACEICGTVENAARSAARAAKPGDCILLSPGAASFDQFKNYGERGDCFASCASGAAE